MFLRGKTQKVMGYILLIGIILFTIPSIVENVKAQTSIIVSPAFTSFFPIVIKQNPPTTPNLYLIDNSDQDVYYVVSWSNSIDSQNYVLQEATKVDFSDAVDVFQGFALSWSPSSEKYPNSYYYRVMASNQYGQADWSNIQSVTLHPLFVGLKLRWDGNGYVRGSDYYDIGYHWTVECDSLTEPDTIQCDNHAWYNPNPIDWSDDMWNVYYSPSTGEWKGSSVPGDPSWKWGFGWKLGYESSFSNGGTVMIDGQKFTVTGPIDGVTTYGKAIKYWQFVNQNKFLFYDAGSNWTQYVHPGEAILRYDAGGSKILIYENIKRRHYYKGQQTSDSVQYIKQLSSANSIPGSPPFVPNYTINERLHDELQINVQEEWRPSIFR